MSWFWLNRLSFNVSLSHVLLFTVGYFSFILLIPPYQRGFNCSDQSIRHEFRPLLFSIKSLLSSTVLFPLILIYLVERFYCSNRDFAKILNNYAFGFIVNLFFNDIIKRAFGRLRPHAFDFCNLSSHCPSGAIDRYIPSFECVNTEFPQYTTNARLSFYSGHSALGAFAGTYLVCYLNEGRFLSGPSQTRRKLKLMLSCVIFLLYLFPGLSQYMIHWHFITDVLSGFSIGIIFAFVTFHIRPSINRVRNV